jgi:hypothetical protein
MSGRTDDQVLNTIPLQQVDELAQIASGFSGMIKSSSSCSLSFPESVR